MSSHPVNCTSMQRKCWMTMNNDLGPLVCFLSMAPSPPLCDNIWLLLSYHLTGLNTAKHTVKGANVIRPLLSCMKKIPTCLWYRDYVRDQKCMTKWCRKRSSRVEFTFTHYPPPLFSVSNCGEPLPFRPYIPVNNQSVIPSHPAWLPISAHLITMCSATSTYSDIQEFKPIKLLQDSAVGKRKTDLICPIDYYKKTSQAQTRLVMTYSTML